MTSTALRLCDIPRDLTRPTGKPSPVNTYQNGGGHPIDFSLVAASEVVAVVVCRGALYCTCTVHGRLHSDAHASLHQAVGCRLHSVRVYHVRAREGLFFTITKKQCLEALRSDRDVSGYYQRRGIVRWYPAVDGNQLPAITGRW